MDYSGFSPFGAGYPSIFYALNTSVAPNIQMEKPRLPAVSNHVQAILSSSHPCGCQENSANSD